MNCFWCVNTDQSHTFDRTLQPQNNCVSIYDSDHTCDITWQLLSAGAAAMNMLNAIHLLGYAGIWVTGANAYDARVNEALGFRAPSRLVGFLAVGTSAGAPDTTTATPRPERSAHIFEWNGPSPTTPAA